MEESKLNIKDEIEDPLGVPTSSVYLKTESFDDNIDYAFQGIEMPNFVECDVNAYLSNSESEEEVKKTIKKKKDASGSSDDYSSSDSSDEETPKRNLKKTVKKKPVKQKKEWQCSVCKKFCGSKHEKIQHEKVHTKGKDFPSDSPDYCLVICLLFLCNHL